jgi:hypothetical protein
MRYFAGIGSRKTPASLFNFIKEIITLLPQDFILRSGAADGADKMFEQAASECGLRAEIWLPWKGFNSHSSTLYPVYNPSALDFKIAKRYHPNWNVVQRGARMMHIRNVHQILGVDLHAPCEFVICYTADGSEGITTKETGGTGQALRLAYDLNIPIINIARGKKNTVHRIKQLLESNI